MTTNTETARGCRIPARLLARAAVALALVTAGILVPAAAASAYGCYAQQERIGVDARTFLDPNTGARVWRSQDILIDSPCHDINLRGSWSEAARHGAVIHYRVRLHAMASYPSRWVAVGRGWQVVFPGAGSFVPGTQVYTIEADQPASVVVAG